MLQRICGKNPLQGTFQVINVDYFTGKIMCINVECIINSVIFVNTLLLKEHCKKPFK